MSFVAIEETKRNHVVGMYVTAPIYLVTKASLSAVVLILIQQYLVVPTDASQLTVMLATIQNFLAIHHKSAIIRFAVVRRQHLGV